MSILLAVCLLAVSIIWLIVYKTRHRKNYHLPPGPRGFPFLGNNFQIAKNPHMQLSKWAEQYGKLYTITIGNGIPALVVNDVTTIKQIFSLTESTGRFISEIHDAIFDGPHGVVNSEGIVWREQREFCVKKLKSLGFNKSSYIEPEIISQVNKLCDWLEKEVNKGGKVFLHKSLTETSGSTIWEIITREQPEDNLNLMINLMENMQRASNTGLLFFSWIKYIAPNWSGYRSYLKACGNLHNYVKSCFAKYEEKLDNDDGRKHMVSAYIEHMKKMKTNVSSSFHGEEGYKHSFQSVVALLFAGVETAASTLHWVIFYLCVNPEVQKHLQEEIDEKIGNDRFPSLADRENMPYAEAVILETLRVSSINPVGMLQRLLEDITYDGYKLPKDLILMPNIYHAHYSVWDDPENFRPERFFDNNNFGDEMTLNGLKHSVVAFQAGKRVCPGEQMSKEVLFLFMTGLLQKFSFSMEDGTTAEMYMEPVVGVIHTPNNNLAVKAMSRN